MKFADAMQFPFVAAALACALAASAGCSKPKTPDQDVPPPMKSADAAPTALNEAINRPIDEANAARDTTEDAAASQRESIDAATAQ